MGTVTRLHFSPGYIITDGGAVYSLAPDATTVVPPSLTPYYTTDAAVVLDGNPATGIKEAAQMSKAYTELYFALTFDVEFSAINLVCDSGTGSSSTDPRGTLCADGYNFFFYVPGGGSTPPSLGGQLRVQLCDTSNNVLESHLLDVGPYDDTLTLDNTYPAGDYRIKFSKERPPADGSSWWWGKIAVYEISLPDDPGPDPDPDPCGCESATPRTPCTTQSAGTRTICTSQSGARGSLCSNNSGTRRQC